MIAPVTFIAFSGSPSGLFSERAVQHYENCYNYLVQHFVIESEREKDNIVTFRYLEFLPTVCAAIPRLPITAEPRCCLAAVSVISQCVLLQTFRTRNRCCNGVFLSLLFLSVVRSPAGTQKCLAVCHLCAAYLSKFFVRNGNRSQEIFRRHQYGAQIADSRLLYDFPPKVGLVLIPLRVYHPSAHSSAEDSTKFEWRSISKCFLQTAESVSS